MVQSVDICLAYLLLVECLQMTSGRDVILVAITESTFGRQDSGKTRRPSRNLCGNGHLTRRCKTTAKLETRPWATQTGARVNQTMLGDMRHASICLKSTVISGMTKDATTNSASYAKTADFRTSTEAMT